MPNDQEEKPLTDLHKNQSRKGRSNKTYGEFFGIPYISNNIIVKVVQAVLIVVLLLLVFFPIYIVTTWWGGVVLVCLQNTMIKNQEYIQ
ncbi:hypothetical protein [Ehrlichia ruminantium]|uniref:hypothetical protein n=1 Tax=Ehrlichia ruminantium TaxID=779 RepID=UPI00130D6EB7|nr:hypothetical protein [Ehrlichia ruminantium]